MTTTCERCRERLIDHHYGELVLDETREVAAHLSDCSGCALEYCRLSAALAGFRALDRDLPRPEVQRTLREKVAAELQPTWWRRASRLLSLPVPVYQPALVLLLLLFIWTLMTSLTPKAASGELRTVLERFDGASVDMIDQHVL